MKTVVETFSHNRILLKRCHTMVSSVLPNMYPSGALPDVCRYAIVIGKVQRSEGYVDFIREL